MAQRKSPCFCLRLRRLTGAIARRYDLALSPLGITVGQFSILANISRSGPLSVRELADLSELERSTLARNLKPILAKGWIVDSKALSARNSRLSLTEKGQKVLAEARELWERAQKEVQDRLGEEGVKAFDLIAEALSGDPD